MGGGTVIAVGARGGRFPSRGCGLDFPLQENRSLWGRPSRKIFTNLCTNLYAMYGSVHDVGICTRYANTKKRILDSFCSAVGRAETRACRIPSNKFRKRGSLRGSGRVARATIW